MKKVLFVVLMAFFTTSSFAQKDSLRLGWQLVFPEYNQADISGLNSFLTTNGFPKASYWPFSIQAGASLAYKRFHCSFNVGGLKKAQPDKYGDTSVACSGNFVSIDFGYNVVHLNKFRLYPFVGLKTTGFTYDFKINQSYSLTNYLQSQFYDKKMQYTRLNLDMGLGLEYGKLFFIGAKAGFYVPINNGLWQAEGKTFSGNIPTIKYSYFVGLYFGFRGFNFKK